jgi:hypothetical protein
VIAASTRDDHVETGASPVQAEQSSAVGFFHE